MTLTEICDLFFEVGYQAGRMSRLQRKSQEPQERTQKIIDMVCRCYGVSREGIGRRSNKREVVWPRQVLMYVLRTHTRLSQAAIGREVGGWDRTSVIHAVKTVKDQMETNESIRAEVTAVETLIMELPLLQETSPKRINTVLATQIDSIKRAPLNKQSIYIRAAGKITPRRPPAEYSNTGHLNIIKKLER